MEGVKIDIDGKVERIKIKDIMKRIKKNDYKLYERIDLEDGLFLYIYGCLDLTLPFNKFEFNKYNYTGIVYSVMFDIDLDMFIDMEPNDFISLYKDDVDLEDYLLEDEIESIDSYDYEDGFIIKGE